MGRTLSLLSALVISSNCLLAYGAEGPDLLNYPKSVAAGDNDEKKFVAAMADYKEAKYFCNGKQDFYEAGSKRAEGWRLSVGTAGGILGFVGTLIASAGTGGAAAGIASGLAGVASTTLGSAEKGPLAPSVYSANQKLVAKTIVAASAKLSEATTPQAIYKIAVSLAGDCSIPIEM